MLSKRLVGVGPKAVGALATLVARKRPLSITVEPDRSYAASSTLSIQSRSHVSLEWSLTKFLPCVNLLERLLWLHLERLVQQLVQGASTPLASCLQV